jgi:hypothetical protein
VLQARTLAHYFSRRVFAPASLVYDLGQPATEVFFVERGVVQLLLPQSQRGALYRTGSSHAAGGELGGGDGISGDAFQQVKKVSFGGIFADVSFFLSRDYK